jgi:hypothetical protein
MEVGLEANAEKLSICSCLVIIIQDEVIIQKIAIRSFENVEKFGYFGATITNQNYIHEKIKIILN